MSQEEELAISNEGTALELRQIQVLFISGEKWSFQPFLSQKDDLGTKLVWKIDLIAPFSNPCFVEPYNWLNASKIKIKLLLIKMLVIYLLFLSVGFSEMTTLDLKLKVAKLNKILAQVVQLDEEDGAVETDFWTLLFQLDDEENEMKMISSIRMDERELPHKGKDDLAFFVALFCSFITMSVHRQQKKQQILFESLRIFN